MHVEHGSYYRTDPPSAQQIAFWKGRVPTLSGNLGSSDPRKTDTVIARLFSPVSSRHEFFPPAGKSRVGDPILAQISIFGGVTDTQQKAIFKRLEMGVIKKGQYIFQKGDEPSHIYIVKSGRIELFIPDEGNMVEKKVLGVGGCFGQVALMSIHRHTISAVALDDSEIILFSPAHPASTAPGRHRVVCLTDDEHRARTGQTAPVHR